MAEYSGSIDLISGIRPKNGGKFPLVEAKDIQVDKDGTRLDAKLKELLEYMSSYITPYTEEEYQAAKEAGEIDPTRLYVIYDPTEA